MSKKVLLAIGAHPDDIDFGASGTIAKMVSEGWDAYYVICTDGSKGSSDPDMTGERLTKIREDEQRAAGKVLGLKDVFFLDHPDTELACNKELKEQLVRLIRKYKPELVIGLDPTFFYSTEPMTGHDYHFVNHTDHRAAGLATMDAVFPLSRDRLTYPEHEKEGLVPHRVDRLWLVNWGEKNPCEKVDITKTLDKKLKAIEAHKSQFSELKEVCERIRNRAKKHADGEDYDFAESFLCLKMS